MAAGMGLSTQKQLFKNDVKQALKDGFKATFLLGDGDYGNDIAEKFAEKASGPLVDAIETFIKSAKITGTHALLPTEVVSPMGPCSGAIQLNIPGELRLE